MNTSYIIRHLGLVPLPGEGGYFRETYRSSETISSGCLPPRYGSEKGLSTAIYYLITAEAFSALHRLPSDEVFHFYAGDPVTMLQLCPDGTGKELVLGNDLEKGQYPQCIVTRGIWQGMRLVDGGSFALLGTTVAPAFDAGDLELGNRGMLIGRYPDYEYLIRQLTSE
ncbi:cupin domain-containing protein [bacterium]|nr:cupin domain-containing protein [bacterium]